MNLPTLSRLAWRHLLNAAAEELYLRAACDITAPVVVHAIVTQRCNGKCRYCEFWRLSDYDEEMTIEEWQSALQSLKQFIGQYFVEFSGGEPFVKKGFTRLMHFCREQGIRWGVTTNGMALRNKDLAEEVVSAHPFNINISADAHLAPIHDYLRGVPGSLQRITEGISNLSAERDRQRVGFPIIIKPTVSANNLRVLPELVQWGQKIGATAVNFQPLDRWTAETYNELWVESHQFDELQRVRDRLIEMKTNGAPILNPEFSLRLWPAHFREEKAPREALPCRVGLRNYFIQANGDVELCWHFPSIGNVREQSARQIWHSEEARRQRKATISCERLCLFTCLSPKTLLDKAKMAFKLFISRRSRHLHDRPRPHREDEVPDA